MLYITIMHTDIRYLSSKRPSLERRNFKWGLLSGARHFGTEDFSKN